jgi:glycosyltransferase involved in cell wall biosynthesis
VVGDGELRPGFARLAEELGVAELVRFAGYVTEEELPAHYRACDFLVLCSDRLESFGLVQVEAMACELPVIVCALPGVVSVSDSGVHGYHVRPGDRADLVDKMRTMVLATPEERSAMGRAGRARVLDRFTWKTSVDQLERALRQAVACGPQGAVTGR